MCHAYGVRYGVRVDTKSYSYGVLKVEMDWQNSLIGLTIVFQSTYSQTLPGTCSSYIFLTSESAYQTIENRDTSRRFSRFETSCSSVISPRASLS